MSISPNEPRSGPKHVNHAFTPHPHPTAAPRSFRLLTEAERHASMLDALTGWREDEDVWIYGYGSLIWRPEFQFAEQRAALLHGYHRALCLWSRVNRGTPDQPGLVFGLDVGGSCRGMAYRIRASDVPTTMEALWRREMPSGAYIPRWLKCRTEHGVISALTFTMNRNTDAYVRDLPAERLIDIVQNAHGSYGPCIEYVLETAQALKQSNIRDKRLQMLVHELHKSAGHDTEERP